MTAGGLASIRQAWLPPGQLTMMLRLLGAKPPEGTDLIRYYRETAAQA